VGEVVELDGCHISPMACPFVEGDGVSDFLGAGGEHTGGELNERNVGGSISSIVVEPPDAKASAALAGLEGGVEGAFGHGSPAGEHDHGGEGAPGVSNAVGEGHLNGPGADKADGGLRSLGAGEGRWKQRDSKSKYGDEGVFC